ncbi:MAG: hypothetical protein V3U87_13365 [Methylococcaceae bacterium]
MKHTFFQLTLKFSLIILIFSAQVRATSIKPIFEFQGSTTPLDYYIDNDWNPADDDTFWLGQGVGALNPAAVNDLDFEGSHAIARFVSGGDLWETVSVISPGVVPDLTGTQEIQLAINPNYSNDPKYISVLLRLTMADGSFWDQIKSFVNNRWQKGVFSTKPHKFIRPEWSVTGEFNLSNVVSWEVILVDLPVGEHTVKFHSLLMKGDYDVVDPNIAENFDAIFPSDESSILFLKNDSNPHDGDTQWLYHSNKLSHYASPDSFTNAAYRFEDDNGESISIKKESQSYFDLSQANQIVARLNNLDFQSEIHSDSPLIMKLTMDDGSVWHKGIPQNQDLIQGNLGYVDYIFPIDDQGNGWKTGSSGSQTGLFDLSRIKAWELVFNHLPIEEQSTNFQKIIFHRVFASNDENSLLSNIKLSVDDWNSNDGDMTWESSFYTFGDGLTARFSSGGDLWESVSIHPKTSIDVIQTAYHIDILSSYANPIYDAVAVQLTMLDGSLWQQSFSLPLAGRYT